MRDNSARDYFARPTQKQLAFIADIQEFVGKQFTGVTKEDARAYISQNIEMYELLSMDSWALENGYF